MSSAEDRNRRDGIRHPGAPAEHPGKEHVWKSPPSAPLSLPGWSHGALAAGKLDTVPAAEGEPFQGPPLPSAAMELRRSKLAGAHLLLIV